MVLDLHVRAGVPRVHVHDALRERGGGDVLLPRQLVPGGVQSEDRMYTLDRWFIHAPIVGRLAAAWQYRRASGFYVHVP